MTAEHTGNKYDANKPPMGLLPWVALVEVARVLDHGRGKYGANSWQKVRPGCRYLDAGLRHIAAYTNGEDVDKDSGLVHLAHAACNVLFLLHFELNGIDGRHPKPL